MGIEQVLADRSPDGRGYSTQFAQFATTEAVIQQALPNDPASAAAVNVFMARYRTEHDRVERENPTPVMMPM